mgnify:CR=1 FL=1
MGRNDLQMLFTRKKKAKERLFAAYWPTLKTSVPLLVIFGADNRLPKKTLFEFLDGLLVLDIVTIVVDDKEMPDLLKHPQGKISFISTENGRNDPKIDLLLDGADMALVFDEKKATLQNLFKKGVIPIGAEKSPILDNYKPVEETGNSFTFRAVNSWDIFAAVVRAVETYRFPYDWEYILRGVLKVR